MKRLSVWAFSCWFICLNLHFQLLCKLPFLKVCVTQLVQSCLRILLCPSRTKGYKVNEISEKKAISFDFKVDSVNPNVNFEKEKRMNQTNPWLFKHSHGQLVTPFKIFFPFFLQCATFYSRRMKCWHHVPTTLERHWCDAKNNNLPTAFGLNCEFSLSMLH